MVVENVKEITGKDFVTQKGDLLSSVFCDVVEEYLQIVEQGDYETIKNYCVTTDVAVKTAKNVVELASFINGSETEDLKNLPSSLYETIGGESCKIISLTEPVPVSGSMKYDEYKKNMDSFRILVTSHVASVFGLPNKYKSDKENTEDLILMGSEFDEAKAKKIRKQIVSSKVAYASTSASIMTASPFVIFMMSYPVSPVLPTIFTGVMGGIVALAVAGATVAHPKVLVFDDKPGKKLSLPILGHKKVKSYLNNFQDYMVFVTGSMKSYLLQFRS